MFKALWVHNGELETISAEEALKLAHYEDEQFNSSDSKDIQERLEEEKAEQERLRKEQAEREEEERLLKEKPNLCDVKLPPKYRMEARIITTRGKDIDVTVCHFPDGKFKACKIEMYWKDLNWEDPKWHNVSEWFFVNERSTKVIEIYTKPVLMEKYK